MIYKIHKTQIFYFQFWTPIFYSPSTAVLIQYVYELQFEWPSFLELVEGWSTFCVGMTSSLQHQRYTIIQNLPYTASQHHCHPVIWISFLRCWKCACVWMSAWLEHSFQLLDEILQSCSIEEASARKSHLKLRVKLGIAWKTYMKIYIKYYLMKKIYFVLQQTKCQTNRIVQTFVHIRDTFVPKNDHHCNLWLK